MSVMNFGPRTLKVGALRTVPRSITAAAYTVDNGTVLDDGHSSYLNRAAGTAVTLPHATGSGKRYRFVVGTASNANTIATAPTTDVFAGQILINNTGDTSAATVDSYPTAANSNKISPTTVGGGGAVGDWIEVEDIAAGVWQVHGAFQLALDPVTPFSHV
jgi:hypothetical protein